MRLEPRAGERIDRSKAISFTFAGWKVTGFEGDTIASAAFAAGKRVFSRSFKYHRPRGLLCCSGHCPNCQMTVDGVPNVRVCTEPIREGAVVEGQNVRWSLDFDFMSLTDKVGGPFTPVGFYYRTFIRPRAAWPLYEKFLRGAAGLGKLDPHAGHTRRYDTEHRRARVLVVGGGAGGPRGCSRGREGRSRRRSRRRGRAASVTTRSPESRSSHPRARSGSARAASSRSTPARVLYRFRAERIVVATGATEQPLVFPGNDLVGVMLPDGVRRLDPRLLDQARRAGDRPRLRRRDARDRRRARGRSASRSRRSSTCATHVRASSQRRAARVASGASSSTARATTATSSSCPAVASPPTRSSPRRARASSTTTALGVFVPTELPAGVEAVGSVTGEGLVEGRPRARVPRQGQVLRLRLRGRDDEGPEARDRRGLRLDRAREAVHDGDDGPVPGEALPPLEHPRLRAGEPDVRVRDRHDDRAAAVGAGRARACSPVASSRRRGAARSTGATRRRARRSCGRGLEAPVCVRRARPRTRCARCTSRSA